MCAPRSKSSWSVHCRPSSSGHTSLFMTSPHFLASPLPAFADTTLHIARPKDLPDPTSPARTVPPEAKTNSPEDTSRSVQWPRRSTWKDKRGCSHPVGPRPNNGRAADCQGHLKLEGRDILERGRYCAGWTAPASGTLPCSLSFMHSPFVWNYLNGRSVAALC